MAVIVVSIISARGLVRFVFLLHQQDLVIHENTLNAHYAQRYELWMDGAYLTLIKYLTDEDGSYLKLSVAMMEMFDLFNNGMRSSFVYWYRNDNKENQTIGI